MARDNKVPEHPCDFCGKPTTNPICCSRLCGARRAQKMSYGTRVYVKVPVEERYQSYVLCGVRKTDCYQWLSFYSTQGYPMVWSGDKKTQINANRLSWELFHERPIPKKKVVGNTCETKGCTNPLHLKMGAHGEIVSARLRVNRKSAKYGDKHASTKLPDTGVELLRKLHREGRRDELITLCHKMSEHYGMSYEYLRTMARTKPGRNRRKKPKSRHRGRPTSNRAKGDIVDP